MRDSRAERTKKYGVPRNRVSPEPSRRIVESVFDGHLTASSTNCVIPVAGDCENRVFGHRGLARQIAVADCLDMSELTISLVNSLSGTGPGRPGRKRQIRRNRSKIRDSRAVVHLTGQIFRRRRSPGAGPPREDRQFFRTRCLVKLLACLHDLPVGAPDFEREQSRLTMIRIDDPERRSRRVRLRTIRRRWRRSGSWPAPRLPARAMRAAR